VEYLSMRGHLGVEDLESLEQRELAPIRYQTIDPVFERLESAAARDTKTGELDVRI